MKRTFLKSVTGVVGLVVFLAILVAANMLLSATRLRRDLTQEKLYTLAPGTRQVLANLPQDVTLKFYYSRSNEDVPIQFKQYGARILDLLHEYALLSKGRLSLEVYDPKPDSDEEEWAQRYGLSGQPMTTMGEGANVYLGLAAISGAKESAIPIFAPNQEPRLEYMITRMITDVTSSKKPKLGIYSPLPVMGDAGMPPMMGKGTEDPWVFVTELMNDYDVQPITPLFDSIPDTIDTLLVIHPKEITDAMLFALDQFVLRGGHLIAFVDPVCLADAESAGQDPRGFLNAHSDLNKLTKAWGYEMDAAKVVADSKAATHVRFATGKAERSLTWLTLGKTNLGRKDIVTGSLEIMMVPFAGAFKGKAADGLTATPLMQSSAGAGVMNALAATMGGNDNAGDVTKEDEPLTLALRLTGNFKTAFPQGKPRDPADTNAPPASTSQTWLNASQKPGAVVLVGDVDFLSDHFAVERMNFFGRSTYQLANDNINFAVNLAEQMSGSDALIGLRSRDAYRRPFTRVVALEETAAEQWRAEEMKLQQKLKDTQLRLTQLQTTKDPDQKYVLSPQQQHEIATFKKQEFDTRKQLKEVKKSLRRDIEALGLKLKMANMALVPALVAVFGIGCGLRRRYRSSAP